MKNSVYVGPVAICKFVTDEKSILEDEYLTCPKLICEMHKKKIMHGLVCNLCGCDLRLSRKMLKISNIDIETLTKDIDNNMIEMSSFMPQLNHGLHYWISNTDNNYSCKITASDEVMHHFYDESIKYALQDFVDDNFTNIELLYMMYGKDNVLISWVIFTAHN